MPVHVYVLAFSNLNNQSLAILSNVSMYCHTFNLSFYIGEKNVQMVYFFSVHQLVGLGFRRGVLYV